ncbi:MAG: PLP-dependent transferase [Ignavibacteriota bacterium]
MTHASMPAAVREAMGITSDLVQVSVGLEDLRDLVVDSEQALDVQM